MNIASARTVAELDPHAEQALGILVHLMGDTSLPVQQRWHLDDAISEATRWVSEAHVVDGHLPVPGTAAQAQDLLRQASRDATAADAVIAYALAARMLQDIE